MKYNVTVREVFSKSITVDADSIEDAKKLVFDMVENDQLTIEDKDFIGRDMRTYNEGFEPLEEWIIDYYPED